MFSLKKTRNESNCEKLIVLSINVKSNVVTTNILSNEKIEIFNMTNDEIYQNSMTFKILFKITKIHYVLHYFCQNIWRNFSSRHQLSFNEFSFFRKIQNFSMSKIFSQLTSKILLSIFINSTRRLILSLLFENLFRSILSFLLFRWHLSFHRFKRSTF